MNAISTTSRPKMADFPKPLSDLTEIIEWAIGAIMFCICWIYFINKYFKSKSEEKQEFIQNVVIATVKATLDSELSGVRADIKTLFKYRDDDSKRAESNFRELLKEIRK